MRHPFVAAAALILLALIGIGIYWIVQPTWSPALITQENPGSASSPSSLPRTTTTDASGEPKPSYMPQHAIDAILVMDDKDKQTEALGRWQSDQNCRHSDLLSARFDKDNNGYVDDDLRQDYVAGIKTDRLRRVKEAMAAFHATYDRDHDGKISGQEWDPISAVFSRIDPSQGYVSEYRAYIALIDFDKSRYLDEVESIIGRNLHRMWKARDRFPSMTIDTYLPPDLTP